jgi:hypothetical protein
MNAVNYVTWKIRAINFEESGAEVDQMLSLMTFIIII